MGVDFDTIEKICQLLDLKCNNIITFEDFIEHEFKKSYKEVKDDEKIKLLRKTWNVSTESLLIILNEIRSKK